jgi:hypothetical protein
MLSSVGDFRTLVLVLLLLKFTIVGVNGRKTTGVGTSSTQSTCPARTINYITQSLPQQCLSTPWAGDASLPDAQNATAIRRSNEKEVGTSGTSIVRGTPTNTASLLETSTPSVKSTFETTASFNQGHLSITNSSAIPSGPTVKNVSPAPAQSSMSLEKKDETDSDPFEEGASFLSFEEWKAQMLKKKGQSPELASRNADGGKVEPGRQRATISNTLDSLGDEGEIEINFSGFVSNDLAAEALPPIPMESPETTPNDGDKTRQKVRKPDSKAGTTSRERFNYASFDCAATILKTNPECKGATSILAENKDSYMLNKCSAKNKFLIVELCNDIDIDTIVLGNFEYFSSTFRQFRVSTSDTYPVALDKWRVLGTFEARNTRGLQAFSVTNSDWARFLRIEFLTHYGKEYYCPVSVLRVHGKTMIDEWKTSFKSIGVEDEIDETEAEIVADTEMFDSAPITVALETAEASQKFDTVTAKDEVDPGYKEHHVGSPKSSPTSSHSETISKGSRNNSSPNGVTFRDDFAAAIDLVSGSCLSSRYTCNANRILLGLLNIYSPNTSAQNRSSEIDRRRRERDASSGSSTQNTVAASTIVSPIQGTNNTKDSEVKKIQSTSTATVIARTRSDGSALPSTKVAQSPQPVPSTQESFFKSVHKRLQSLEANSTLSLQYIEEQSRTLREAFSKVEKRQLSKTTTFLETLNTTVLSELREFRLQYDQIWQSTVLELSSQREQSQREVIELSTRLTILADEILYQKKMVYVQFILILLCLALAIFPRTPTGSKIGHGEIPLLSSFGKQSSSGLVRYLNLDSPPDSRPISRFGRPSKRGVHNRSPSNDTTYGEDLIAPDLEYQPPTPRSMGMDGIDDESSLLGPDSPSAEPQVMRAASSPEIRTEAMTDTNSVQDSPGSGNSDEIDEDQVLDDDDMGMVLEEVDEGSPVRSI